MTVPCYTELMAAARDPRDLATLVFAGVMANAATRAAPYDAAIAGLDGKTLDKLLASCFPGMAVVPTATEASDESDCGARNDEFADLVVLLLEHATFPGEKSRWLAHAIATASMGDNHLWQDMGLPHRKALSQLMERYFTSLFIRNVGDMKWKKFFYRQLCEKEEVLICKSPSCSVCTDFHHCFGPEEGVPVGAVARGVQHVAG